MSKTTQEDNAALSSIQGLSYVCDKKLSLLERLIWLLVCVVMMGYGMQAILILYTGWQDSLVLTTVSNTGTKIIHFPVKANKIKIHIV